MAGLSAVFQIWNNKQLMETLREQRKTLRGAGQLNGTREARPSAGIERNLISGSAASGGFTMPELLVAMAIGTVLTVMSVPVVTSAMSRMRMNSGVASITTTISKTRYRSIRNSDVYTLTITAPQNTYVVTDVSANVVDPVEPLPSLIALNGGAAATYTYTFCPNGTVYGAGGVCANNLNPPPALVATYRTRQTNLSVSTVGNVTAKIIH